MCKISGHNARLLLSIVALISGLVAYSYGDTKISGTPSIVIFKDKIDRLKSAGGKFQKTPLWKVIFKDRKAAEEKFQKAANIVEAKCTEYNDKIYKIIQVSTLPGRPPSFIKELDCKASKPLIVGGIKAEPKEFPHMALLGYIKDNKTDWRCGGSLISDRFVLSAAHCEPNERERPDLVLLGELDYSKDTDDARPTYYKIVERFKHPHYSPPNQDNDIILYKLNHKVKFDGYIRPICLSTSRLSVRGMNATITGWGRLDTIEKLSSILKKATVGIFDNEVCESAFRNHAYYPYGVDKNAIICAGNKDRREDTCQGDSGGPLQISAGTCLWKQLGIISTGSGICANPDYPGMTYTRVAHYIEWIQSIVWPETK